MALQLTDELGYGLCFAPRIAFNCLDNRAANDSGVSKGSDLRKLLVVGDSKAHSHWKLSVFADALYQTGSVAGELIAGTGYSGPRHCVNETTAGLRDGFQSLIGAGGGGQENRIEPARVHSLAIFAGFFNGQVSYERTIDSRFYRMLAKLLETV